MLSRDYKDILGGGVLIAVGLFAAVYAVLHLTIGPISRMGPGMFPAVAGILLAVLGLAIFIPALFRRAPAGALAQFDFRSLLAISGGILSFAVLLQPFGLVPAIVAQTLIASRADSKLTIFGAGILACFLSLGMVLLFKIGLGVPVAILNWPR